MAKISISSEINNPILPPILVYHMIDGELKYLATLEYKFQKWKDYGSYLGNYADYNNDFSHSKTVSFSCGVELSNEKLKSGKIYIVTKKQGCFTRENVTFGNPPVVYKEGSCKPKKVLKVEDFENEYVLIKKL